MSREANSFKRLFLEPRYANDIINCFIKTLVKQGAQFTSLKSLSEDKSQPIPPQRGILSTHKCEYNPAEKIELCGLLNFEKESDYESSTQQSKYHYLLSLFFVVLIDKATLIEEQQKQCQIPEGRFSIFGLIGDEDFASDNLQ
ncbi:13361_t:CDS:2 [Funneliformis geosporum]|nr:13361_t:CDS:2 [Funneliformis geosporum]